jgi:hypothetical protein
VKGKRSLEWILAIIGVGLLLAFWAYTFLELQQRRLAYGFPSNYLSKFLAINCINRSILVLGITSSLYGVALRLNGNSLKKSAFDTLAVAGISLLSAALVYFVVTWNFYFDLAERLVPSIVHLVVPVVAFRRRWFKIIVDPSVHSSSYPHPAIAAFCASLPNVALLFESILVEKTAYESLENYLQVYGQLTQSTSAHWQVVTAVLLGVAAIALGIVSIRRVKGQPGSAKGVILSVFAIELNCLVLLSLLAGFIWVHNKPFYE